MGQWQKGCLVTLGFFGALFASAWFVMNYTILYDPDDVVADARLVWTGGSAPMTRLPWGSYVVYVDGDAGVRVTCRDGTIAEGGYVTGLMADDYTVTERCEVRG